jgi:hypothetical protein
MGIPSDSPVIEVVPPVCRATATHDSPSDLSRNAISFCSWVNTPTTPHLHC